MSNHRHFILHKPFGYLSQFVRNQNRRKNKKLLGELYDFPEGTMSIGRLDENSEGLLLLTTEKELNCLFILQLRETRLLTVQYPRLLILC